MLSKAEMKAIKERANGKPFQFNPRHHWIYEWIQSLPGKSLSDKIYPIVEQAYKDSHRERARVAFDAFSGMDTSEPGTPETTRQILALLGDACDAYTRAGDEFMRRQMADMMGGCLVQIERGTRAPLEEQSDA